MMRCESCGSELPVNALFCGSCGRKNNDRFATLTDSSNTLQTSIPEPQTPPLFSSPALPDIPDSGVGWQDPASTLQTKWDIEDVEGANRPFKHRVTDENDVVFPDALLPGMLALRGQMPSSPQAPMVQGTPQFGGVPSVQGTPATPGNVPQSMPGPAQGAAPATPSNAPMEAQNIPIHHQRIHQPANQPPTHFYTPVHHPQPTPPPHQPVYHPQPTPPPHEVEHEHHHRHHSGPLHKHKLQSSKLQHTAAGSSKAGMGVVSKWIIITVVSLVIIGSSSIFLAHALMPTTPPPVLTITGSSLVKSGSTMSVHGRGFQPGDSITLTIDNGLSVALAGQLANQETTRNVQVAGVSQMNIAGALQSYSAANKSITVSSIGTFDATITVPTGLRAGQHTIHATDNQSSLSASLQFTVSSSQLVVNPTTLNFGSVEVGRSVKLLATLDNQGGASLPWTATVEGSNTNWLTLSKNSDVLGTNGASETVIVTADTKGLSVGSHNATLRFHSDNGDVLIAVSIDVVSIGQIGQQPILNVSQQSLDFGQLQAGQSAQKTIPIANLGNLPLQWQASVDTASTGWLSLSTSKGTIQPGAVPQSLQVNVDTSGLAAGSYSGTVNITSNGGNAQVGVTLVVTGSTVTPTPSPTTPTQTSTPTQVPTTPTQQPTLTQITVAPQNIDPTNSKCSQNSDGTYTCNVTVGETAPGNLSWFAPTAIGGTGVSFNPPNGQFTASQTQQSVVISSIPCSSTSFTFTDQNNNTATVAWSCTPPTQIPTQTVTPPNWSVNPTSLDGSTCGQTAPCRVTLTEDVNSTGSINWSASSNIEATFKPQSGTLSPTAQQNSITISILAPCQNDTFTFTGSGGVSPLTVTWTCSLPTQSPSPTPTPTQPPPPTPTPTQPPPPTPTPTPQLTVTPQKIDPTACSPNSDGTYNCTVTVGETSPGNLSWFTTVSIGGTGTSISPQNGKLSASNPQQSVQITSIPCQNGSFTFIDQNNVTVYVTWSCTPPS